MHDAGTLDATDATELAFAMREQRVDERVVARAGAGMHNHAGGFIDREHVLVLENHFERNLHRAHARWDQIRKSERDGGVRQEAEIARNHFPLDAHQPRIERTMKRHAAVLGKRFRENFIGAGRTDVGGDGVSLFDHREVEPRGSTPDHGERLGFREPLLPKRVSRWKTLTLYRADNPDSAYSTPWARRARLCG